MMKRATLFLSKIGSCSLEQRVCDDHMNELLSESFISLGENAILMGSALLKGTKARVKTSQEGSLFCILHTTLSIRVRDQRLTYVGSIVTPKLILLKSVW
jgi:hypothetical protein